MKDISFVRYSVVGSSSEVTSQFVDCYREVFADTPWHEWMKCSKCQKYWGIKDRVLLESWGFRHCGVYTVEFWTKDQVLRDLQEELKPNASCWLAIHKGKVVGFCFGYPATISSLEKKLGIEIREETDKQFGPYELVAYQDDVGVLAEYRGKKIAKTMVAYRLGDFINRNLHLGIVRTRATPEPSVTFMWYKKLGYTTLAEYPNGDGRVILARQLDGLSPLL